MKYTGRIFAWGYVASVAFFFIVLTLVIAAMN